MDTNSANSVSGDSSATLENGGGAATSPPTDLHHSETNDAVSSLSLVGNALQAPEVTSVTLNRDGTVRKKPGRKPGQRNGEAAPLQPGQIAAAQRPPRTAAQVKAQQVTSEQTAKMIVGASVGILMEVFGPEWEFRDQGEADSVRIPVQAYIDAKGGAELSPELLLALSLMGYGLPRLQEPNTREKLSGFFRSAWKALRGVFGR